MHPLLRLPYAALGLAAETAAALAPRDVPTSAKWRRGLAARSNIAARVRAFAELRDAARPLVWFHAPSVGETLMALPVMQALRARTPSPQLALTWYSPSAESLAALVDADYRDYLPFDTTRAAESALDALHPNVLVYSKLDVWPVLTATAARRRVRLGMISATLSAKSGRRGAFARALLSEAYAQLDFVGAVSSDDAERLVDLGVRRSAVGVTGDTRYDQVSQRVASISRDSPQLAPLRSDRPTLVAGSTWPADEGPLLAAWERVLERVPDARLVIAPHEPTEAHLAPLRAWAAQRALNTSVLSNPASADAQVVLVDRVGILADIYAIATVAFVGGGFHAAGLHSVVEPAALGVPVLVGPAGSWSRDALGLVAAGGAVQVDSAGAIAEALQTWFLKAGDRSKVGAAASAFVRAGLGATERTLQLVTVGL